MNISYIIPVLNEVELLPRLLRRLGEAMAPHDEIIVADGGSTDGTIAIVEKSTAILVNAPSGRAVQMNRGAERAKHELLFFIHADTLPPVTMRTDILQAMRLGADAGCFRFKFDSNSWLLRLNAYFTRFPMLWCRGGDQGLFIRKELFEKLGGYVDAYRIMEEYELIERLRKTYKFYIVPNYFVVSARKYELNSYIRVQWANLLVYRAYRNGASQQNMIDIYAKWLNLP